jgi:enoyl-CoA hydratase/carnithine racemase
MAAIFRVKLGLAGNTCRATALEGRRWTGEQAREVGMVDLVVKEEEEEEEEGGAKARNGSGSSRAGTKGMDAVLRLVQERKLASRGQSRVLGMIKAEMYRELVVLLSARGPDAKEFPDYVAEESTRKEELEFRVREAKAKGLARL